MLLNLLSKYTLNFRDEKEMSTSKLFPVILISHFSDFSLAEILEHFVNIG